MGFFRLRFPSRWSTSVRDPSRIESTLAVLRDVWTLQPDLRLGQLITIAARPKDPCPGVFDIEDDALLDRLIRFRAGRESSSGGP